MSTITVPEAMTVPGTGTRRAGLLRRVYDAMVVSRHREAQRRIAVHVESLSDNQLRELGFTAAETRSIRAGEPVADLLAGRTRQTWPSTHQRP